MLFLMDSECGITEPIENKSRGTTQSIKMTSLFPPPPPPPPPPPGPGDGRFCLGWHSHPIDYNLFLSWKDSVVHEIAIHI